MKTFRHYIIPIFLLGHFCILNAQVKVTGGPEAGFSYAGLDEGGKSAYAGLNAHLGGSLQLQFKKSIAIRPTALFRDGTMPHDEGLKMSMSRFFLAVPILYSKVFEKRNNFFIGAGPSLMFISSGTVKSETESRHLSFGANQDQVSRFDFGINIKGGYQLPSGVVLSIFSNIGLTNLSNSRTTLKSRDFAGLSFGYMLGSK